MLIQLLKASLPITVILSGITNCPDKQKQLLNTPEDILVNPAGIINLPLNLIQ